MNLNKEKLKATDVAVDTIDFIETKVHKTVQDNKLKDQFIDLVIELVNDHYKTKLIQ